MRSLVVVIGDAALDVRAAPAEPIRPGGDVPATIGMYPGGQAANVAVRLARQGVRVRLVTALGDDAAGRALADGLAADGVQVHRVNSGGPTSAVVVVSDAGGERTMLSQRTPIFDRPLDAAALEGAGWLVVSGYALLESAAAVALTAVALRRAVLGCSLGARDVERWTLRTASLRPHLVVLNADEARAIEPSASDLPGLARAIGARFESVAIVTRATGASAAVGDEVIETSAASAAPAVDTTGAGDAFAAALIASLLDTEWPPDRDRLRRAMLAGHALATAVAGVIGAQGRVKEEEP
ncbi:MAG: hypothetical protein IT341_05775 [Chloroflexi bacterium]|nr:hypothetical protein [Chloroflexota bacterium]